MKLNYGRGIVLLCAAFSICLGSFSQAGIFEAYVITDFGGGNNYRTVANFEGHYYGHFRSTDTFTLTGGENQTFRNNATGNVCGGTLNYRIYRDCATPGAFQTVTLDYCCDQFAPDCDGGTCSVPGAGAGFTNQKWRRNTETINILSGLSKGDYVIEVFMSATGSTVNNFDCSETLLLDNAGANYRAYFSIGEEGFADGDLTDNPAWGGQVGNFAVVDPASLAGDGSNANIGAGSVDNSDVLQSVGGSTDAALTLASTQAYGLWEFSVATGLNWNTSDVNNFQIVLISDTNDPTKLIIDSGTGAPDYNGYAIKLKNGVGDTDTFVLIKQTGTTETELLDLGYPLAANAYSGYTFRILRDSDGDFHVYCDQGFDNTNATTLRGTVRDIDHTTSTTLAVVLNANSGGAARTLFFDNLTLGAITELSLNSTGAYTQVSELDGTFQIETQIADADPLCETTADLVLLTGDATRIGNYTTQALTFPAGSNASVFTSVTVTDNGVCEENEFYEFELQNVSGGCNALATGNNVFVELDDDESGTHHEFEDDFEDNDISTWNNTTDWAPINSAGTISGVYDLHHTGTVAIVDHVSHSLDQLEIRGAQTRWRWNHKPGWSSPSSNNWMMFMIVSEESDMFGGATNGSAGSNSGYAVGTNFNGTNDELRLVRIDNGVYTDIINTGYLWNTTDVVGIEVVRDETGTWELKYQIGGGFDAMTSAGTVLDNTYLCAGYLGVGIEITAGNAGKARVDDISVRQYGCYEDWYTVVPGNASGSIWSQNPLDVVGGTVEFSRYKNLNVRHAVTNDVDYLSRNYFVDAGGVVDAGALKLKVYGDFTNDDTFNAQTGTVEFKGRKDQTVGGTSTTRFNDVIVNSGLASDMVTFGSAAEVAGVLYPEKGTVNPGGNVKLVSDPTGTGSIAEIKADASFANTTIDMQRHVVAGNQIWFNIGNSLTGATIADWDDDITTTGFPGADFEFGDYPFVNLFTYDETDANGLDDGFTAPGDVSDPLASDRGYMVYLEPGSQNIEVSGDFQQGDISQALDFTAAGGVPIDGWNLVVNRYPSEIDWEALYANSTGIGSTYYVHDGDGYAGARNYTFYDAVTSSGTASRYIASSQSFWVKVDAAGGMLEWTEAIKTQNGDPFERGLEQLPLIGLKLQGESSNDHAFLVFDEELTMGHDMNRDAFHLGGGEMMNDPEDAPVGLATIAGDYELSVNNFPVDQAIEIPLKISVLVPQEVTLSVANLDLIPEGMCISIEDLLTGEVEPLNEDYEFTFTTEAYSDVRFMIRFSAPFEIAQENVSCFGATDGSIEVDAQAEGTVDYLWYDEMGNLIFTDSQVDGASEMSGLPFGNYEIHVNDENSECATNMTIIYLDQPSLEELESESELDMCNQAGMGWIQFDVPQADEYWYSVVVNEEEILAGAGEGSTNLEGLLGDEYEITVTTQCGVHTTVVDLTDPNAVELTLSADDEMLYLEDDNDVLLEISSDEATDFVWYLDGTEVSQSAQMTYIFDAPGNYEFQGFASNEFCSVSDIIVIEVQEGANNISDVDANSITLTWDSENAFLSNGELDLGLVQVRFFNAAGQQVRQESVNLTSGARSTISLSDLSQGIYEVEVISDNKSIFHGRILK